MKKIWAVIPARGGSKRLARKNVKPLAGHSLVWRTVKTALNSDLFACVVVSTDDPEITQNSTETASGRSIFAACRSNFLVLQLFL